MTFEEILAMGESARDMTFETAEVEHKCDNHRAPRGVRRYRVAFPFDGQATGDCPFCRRALWVSPVRFVWSPA